eukprot:Filipodium_phascolosomae@DN7381_c0_g1_i1.p1
MKIEVCHSSSFDVAEVEALEGAIVAAGQDHITYARMPVQHIYVAGVCTPHLGDGDTAVGTTVPHFDVSVNPRAGVDMSYSGATTPPLHILCTSQPPSTGFHIRISPLQSPVTSTPVVCGFQSKANPSCAVST